ncbi:uncharacterized protein DS421_14g456660 [Arachis hypogaea]|nr:uncharacterized protein DS421_14g456660 [Arachis hypogaea]
MEEATIAMSIELATVINGRARTMVVGDVVAVTVTRVRTIVGVWSSIVLVPVAMVGERVSTLLCSFLGFKLCNEHSQARCHGLLMMMMMLVCLCCVVILNGLFFSKVQFIYR